MNVFNHFLTIIHAELRKLIAEGSLPEGLALDRVTVEPPRDPSHGDLSTNAAMVLAKAAGQKPRELAEKLSGVLASNPDIASTEVAGPGFLNLRLHPAFWQARIGDILQAKEN